MSDVLYLAWRYLLYHKIKTATLVASITLIVYLPIGLDVLVRQSAEQLTARAAATTLLVGARGSPLELVLNSLYFQSATPAPMRYAEVARISGSGLGRSIPLYSRFRSRKHPIVGTTIDYFEFRGLRVADGRGLAILGECMVGARVAAERALEPGAFVLSSPESVFDIAGVYPLRMKVVGVLARAGTPDDDAIFVDLKTAWIISGLGHGHQDLADPEAATAVLRREEDRIVANASLLQYNEITAENLESFHFHGDLGEFPVTASIIVPADEKSSALLQGRYLGEDEPVQIVTPSSVMDDLLATVFTVQHYVIAAMVLVGLSTVATAALVFFLSIRLRRREIETMAKIGGGRARVLAILSSEIVLVIAVGSLLAAGLAAATSRFGSEAIRMLLIR